MNGHMRILVVMLVGALVVGTNAGCAHVEASGTHAGPAHDLQEYYPLQVGNCWTYVTSFQGQPQADLKTCIVREERGYFIDDRPAPSRLKYDAEGLRDGGVRYLLKAPLQKGARWMSVADVRTVERYEILSVDEDVQVPAGHFHDCVVVRMEVRMDEKHVMHNLLTFAPGVGIVEIRANLKRGTKLIPQSRMRLKEFTPAGGGS